MWSRRAWRRASESMARQRPMVQHADFRTVLAARADVSLGAYGRRQRRRQMLVALGGLGLIGGAIALYAMLSPDFGSSRAAEHAVRVRCIVKTCDYEAEVRISTRQSLPLTCPKCGQRSCRALSKCLNETCGELFLADPSETHPRCPKCKGARVGSAASELVAP